MFGLFLLMCKFTVREDNQKNNRFLNFSFTMCMFHASELKYKKNIEIYSFQANVLNLIHLVSHKFPAWHIRHCGEETFLEDCFLITLSDKTFGNYGRSKNFCNELNIHLNLLWI